MSCNKCKNAYNDSDTIACVLECEHKYCKSCIDLLDNCPVCLAEITKFCECTSEYAPSEITFETIQKLIEEFESFYQSKLNDKEDHIQNLKEQIYQHTNELIFRIISKQEDLLTQVDELSQRIDGKFKSTLEYQLEIEDYFSELEKSDNNISNVSREEELIHIEDCIFDNIFYLNNINLNCDFKSQYLIDLENELCQIGELRTTKYERFLSGSVDGQVKLWSMQSEKCLKKIQAHLTEIRCIKAINDSEFLTGSRDHSIKLWNLGSSDCIMTYLGHAGLIDCIEISYDKEHFMSGSHDTSIKIWNIKTGDCLQTLAGHARIVTDLKLFETNKLVSSSTDASIKMWDLNTCAVVRTFLGHRKLVSCILVTTHNQILSGSADATIRIWSSASKSCIKVLNGHKSGISNMETLDRDHVISASYDLTFRIWNINEGYGVRSISILKNKIGKFILTGLDRLILFKPGMCSIDACNLNDESYFASMYENDSPVSCLQLI